MTPSKKTHRKGFSLIITITMMVLLSLLALGLLGLSSIAVRSSSREVLSRAARDNARLSLSIAIGQLQKLAGPDQRVTAPASILDQSPGSSESDGIAQPYLTGVWKGWRNDPESPEDPSDRKDSDFLGWLASGNGGDGLEDKDDALVDPSGEVAQLVGEGSVSDPDEEVQASLVPVASAEGIDGSYAWSVFDESAKARVTLPDAEHTDFNLELAELAAPEFPDYGAVNDGSSNWGGLATAGDTRLKLITHNQIGLVSDDNRIQDFHDLTPYSLGLPVNVAEGGLSRDLSLLFEQDALPSDYARRYLYSDESKPLVKPPSRFRGANVMPAPDPSWRLMHSHANLHKEVKNRETEPTIGAKVLARPPAGLPPSRAAEYPGFHSQQLAPVIAKAQFIFSIGFGAAPSQQNLKNQGVAKANENWITWLVTDPVVTLWNPYDVSISFENSKIELHRMPMALQLFRNGQSYAPPTLFANTYLPGDFNNRKERFYRLNIKPALDERGKEEDKIVMKPGEYLVFTAHNHVKHYKQAYNKVGVDLRPGWNPPAGAASNHNVGGVSTLNLLVNNSGSNSGRINGKSARSLPVKGGDRITLAVTTAHANVDKFSETDNKELSAFVKYYVESEGSRVSSSPPYVGAIELDLGDQEEEILQAYSQRELPQIIVPHGLPPNQGDNYVGNLPPPAVRWKEPFLIASVHLKTAKDAQFPSRSWLQNSPTNLYSSMGLDQEEDLRNHQYELAWEPMTDWNSAPTVELDTRNRGYGAAGIYAQSGVHNAPAISIPLAAPMSLGQLRHAPINSGGQLPLQSQVVGNSFASPLLAGDKTRSTAGARTYFDHSFYCNSMLFDRYFFSSASSQGGQGPNPSTSAADLLTGLFDGSSKLPNPRMRPIGSINDAKGLADELSEPDGFRRAAAHLAVAGSFNINSTSVDAWRAILASLQYSEPPNIDVDSGSLSKTQGDGTLISRHLPPTGHQLDGTSDPIESEINTWAGHRRLTDYQIERLAEEIVTQVKKRGPFQSLAEFVNRRPTTGELGVAGALQAAIDASDLNAEATAGAIDIPADPAAAFPDAAAGSTADGAPATINQADLLVPLAPLMTARGDTFVIRGYGEAKRGAETARAWCEAVVQRNPEFLNPDVSPESELDSLPEDDAAVRFGRRFNIVAFRWLTQDEV